MKNNLSGETSPYLLQHAENPVFWQPWGNQAFELAKELDRPIFLSIGYSACHWCHVMEKESFENEDTARILNDHFINIKVDREENPEVDQIYMSAVTALTGQGGWPMSMFLTPDGRPFQGGTYFPPEPRHGLPAFPQLLNHIAELWSNDRQKLFSNAKKITEFLLEQIDSGQPKGQDLPGNLLSEINKKLVSLVDKRFTGWGNAPKFPQPMALTYLLNQNLPDTNQIVFSHLEMLSRGGIYDVLGGGFHRYSVDAQWKIPHFEKMLTDNALLSRVYLQAYKLNNDPIFKQTCEQTLDFLLRELQNPTGGFYSSIDADSEDGEGTFYLWGYTQLFEIISDQKKKELFFTSYGISQAGNFEGKHVLQRIASLENLTNHFGYPISEYLNILDDIQKNLFKIRSKRTRPNTDDKILTSWNAYTIQTFAEAGRYLQRNDYLKAAQKAADFILKNMFIDNSLYRSWRNGKVKNHAYLEDYASLILALLALYQTDFDPDWFIQARNLTRIMLEKFKNENEGFFDVEPAHQNLIFKPQNLFDNAVPCGSSLAANALQQMAFFEENFDNQTSIAKSFQKISKSAMDYPLGYAYWLQGLNLFLNPPRQIALVWPGGEEKPLDFLHELWKSYHSDVFVVGAPYPLEKSGNYPSLLHNRPPIKNEPTVYICQGFVCQKPIENLDDLINSF